MFWFNRYGIDYKKDSAKLRLLKYLTYYENKEVSVWDLIQTVKTAHHTQLIMLLRRDWHNIVNRTEHKGRILHSYYKLAKIK